MKKLLFICYYRILPLRGGAIRSFYLTRELSRYHEIYLVIPQREAELRSFHSGYTLSPSVKVYSSVDFPSPMPYLSAESFRDRIRRRWHYSMLTGDWMGPADSAPLRLEHLIRRAFEGQRIDIVIFDGHQLLGLAPLVRRLSPNTKRILNAHNVETVLQSQIGERNSRGFRKTVRLEKKLKNYMDLAWPCSGHDCELLEKISGAETVEILNGIDPEYFNFTPKPVTAEVNRKPEIVFVGSFGYKPNRDALRFLFKDIWPGIKKELPGITLSVVGYGDPGDLTLLWRDDPNVFCHLSVPDTRPYRQKADIAVVPLRQGSGVSMKTLEAMAQGCAVVSTTIGARGIDGKDGKHFMIADTPGQFVSAIKRLLADKGLYQRIVSAARELICEKYNWRIIGKQASDSIDRLFSG